MDIVLGILDQLKINNTIWIQLICFLVTYFFVSNLLFKPYYNAYVERMKRTVGSQEEAAKTLEESDEQYQKYQEKARALNQEIRDVFDQSRKSAAKQQEEIISQAKSEGTQKIEGMRKQVATEVTRAKQDLQKEIPEVSSLIRAKLLGKELSN